MPARRRRGGPFCLCLYAVIPNPRSARCEGSAVCISRAKPALDCGGPRRFAFASTLSSRTRAPRGVRDLLFAFAGRPVFAHVAAGACIPHRARLAFCGVRWSASRIPADAPSIRRNSTPLCLFRPCFCFFWTAAALRRFAFRFYAVIPNPRSARCEGSAVRICGSARLCPCSGRCEQFAPGTSRFVGRAFRLDVNQRPCASFLSRRSPPQPQPNHPPRSSFPLPPMPPCFLCLPISHSPASPQPAHPP